MNRDRRLALQLVMFGLLVLPATRLRAEDFPIPAGEFALTHYVCQRIDTPPVIDGRLDDPAWEQADWTDDFVDIEGAAGPAPRFFTRVKMLWDVGFFYVAALMEEPDVWASLTRRDAVIYHDNDFEVFIDPDGDNHLYYELEINALGTVWDLLLIKPYRDGGPAVNAWDIQGLQTGVNVLGSLNDPTDTDGGWSVELAFPWEVLGQCANRPAPPEEGDIWRVNFSRVEWQTEALGTRYTKVRDPETDQPLPEANWVWSPQGLINMHYPEMWGNVVFVSGVTSREDPVTPPSAPARRGMQVYYQQKRWHASHGSFAASVELLDLPRNWRWPGHELTATASSFEFSGPTAGGRLYVNHLGRCWLIPDDLASQ
ncbi:MAG: carbohydrate-binding family 9-like protein [bacterium]